LEDFVRTLPQACLSFILSLAVVIAPVLVPPANSATAPLGVVLQAENAQVGADITAGGATVYDGDRLQTDNGGALRAQLRGSQIYLHQGTRTLVRGLPNGFSADLATGSVVVSATKGQSFQLLADGATFRPRGIEGASAEITRVNDKELRLTTTRGTIEIAMGEEVKTVDTGTSYRMEVETADPDPQPPQGPYHTARNRFVMYALIAVPVATGIVIWRALVSPNSPSSN
jgi:hypothetical protein